MRDDMQLITVPNGTTLRLDAANFLQRLVSVMFDFTLNAPSEMLRLKFMLNDSTFVAAVLAGPGVNGSGTASFVLGGCVQAPHATGFTPASGVYAYVPEDIITGPLPDMWLSQNMKLTLTPDAASGVSAISNWKILREVKQIDLHGNRIRSPGR